MPPLYGAVAFPEEEHVAVGIGQDLRLDVVRPVDVALQEDLWPSEVRLRLARRPLQGLLEVVGVPHDMHALAASAEGGLHQEREPDPRGLLLRLREIDRSAGARHDRHAGRIRDASCRGLVAHRLDHRRRWTHERQPRALDRFRERRPFGQEAVSGVHERGLRLRGDLHDPVDRQVGGRREGGSDPERLVRHLHVQSVPVGVGVDGNRGDAEIAARPRDPDRDLAAVGDQELLLPRHVAQRYSVEVGGHVLNEDALARALAAAGLSAPVRWDDVTGSTNANALALAAEGAPAWTLVGAGHQTAGRGRLGRNWVDRPGAALLCSVVLRPSWETDRLGLAALAAGAAMAEAASEMSGVEVRCKWPNDLLVGGRKVGGILSEAQASVEGIVHVVVGVGVNLEMPEASTARGRSEASSGGPAGGLPPAASRAARGTRGRGRGSLARGVRDARSGRRSHDRERRHDSGCRRRCGRDRGVARGFGRRPRPGDVRRDPPSRSRWSLSPCACEAAAARARFRAWRSRRVC